MLNQKGMSWWKFWHRNRVNRPRTHLTANKTLQPPQVRPQLPNPLSLLFNCGCLDINCTALKATASMLNQKGMIWWKFWHGNRVNRPRTHLIVQEMLTNSEHERICCDKAAVFYCCDGSDGWWLMLDPSTWLPVKFKYFYSKHTMF